MLQIANHLQNLLDTTGISQRELARAINTRPNTISDYASNRITKYDMTLVARICQYFGISIRDFLYDYTVTDDNIQKI